MSWKGLLQKICLEAKLWSFLNQILFDAVLGPVCDRGDFHFIIETQGWSILPSWMWMFVSFANCIGLKSTKRFLYITKERPFWIGLYIMIWSNWDLHHSMATFLVLVTFEQSWILGPPNRKPISLPMDSGPILNPITQLNFPSSKLAGVFMSFHIQTN